MAERAKPSFCLAGNQQLMSTIELLINSRISILFRNMKINTSSIIHLFSEYVSTVYHMLGLIWDVVNKIHFDGGRQMNTLTNTKTYDARQWKVL